MPPAPGNLCKPGDSDTPWAPRRAVVLVELDDDLGLSGGPDAVRVVAIDHHGNRAGADRPTSLEQGFERLDRPWEHATGPRMPEDKARSARNGRAHR